MCGEWEVCRERMEEVSEGEGVGEAVGEWRVMRGEEGREGCRERMKRFHWARARERELVSLWESNDVWGRWLGGCREGGGGL